MSESPITEAFLVVPCIVVQCSGGCCDPFGPGGPPHFETVDEAIAVLRDEAWVFVGKLAWCPSCAAKADCGVTGHQWDEWADDAVEGLPCKQRTCGHCAEQEYEPPLRELQVLIQMREIGWGGDDETR
ncbi:hypothetical protein AB0B10_26085 [Micromonospora arborensis]|uniref:hypothetical protein n=1 Tax=Micromonospora arborensis TaxID=2116518 RepID=UPI00340C8F0A